MAKRYPPGARFVSRTAARRSSRNFLRSAGYIGVIVLCLAGAFGLMATTYAFSQRNAISGEDLCLESGAAPVSVLVLVDRTDPLARESGRRFERVVQNLAGELPQHGRLSIVPFDGDLGSPLTPIFDWCSPGTGRETDLLNEGRTPKERRYNEHFAAPLSEAIERLSQGESAPLSPIAEQIERALADPGISWDGDRRILVVLTDGLQHTAQSPIYTTGSMDLPRPASGGLDDIEVRYVELTNRATPQLQTPELREAWRAWFEAQDANIKMYAPGFRRPS